MTAARVPAAPPPQGAPRHPLTYRLMVGVARRVPLRLGYLAGDGAAAAAWLLWKGKRKAAQRNYAAVLGAARGHGASAALARRALRNFARSIVEMFHHQTLDRDDLLARVAVRNPQHLDAALAHNHGVIFVGAHIGTMSAAGAALTLAGRRVVAAAECLRPEMMMRYVERERAQWGIATVPVGRAGRRLLQALQERSMVVLFADVGVKPTGGVRVSFFGKDTYFPAGPAWLSRLSGAPMLFGCAIRNGRSGYDVILGSPVLPRRTGDARADMVAMTQEVVDQMEALIRRFPDQWYIFRDMWPRGPLPPLPRRACRSLPVDAGSAAS